MDEVMLMIDNSSPVLGSVLSVVRDAVRVFDETGQDETAARLRRYLLSSRCYDDFRAGGRNGVREYNVLRGALREEDRPDYWRVLAAHYLDKVREGACVPAGSPGT